MDGIILVGSNFIYEKEEDNKYITDASAQVPVMLLNAAMDAPNVYSVVSDDFTSMYDATMEMIRSGVEDILYFYNSTSYSGKKKLAGYRAAMEEKGLLTNGSFLQLYQGSHEDIPAMADQLKKLHAKESLSTVLSPLTIPGSGCSEIRPGNGTSHSGRSVHYRL